MTFARGGDDTTGNPFPAGPAAVLNGSHPICAVLFDLDGVIVFTDRYHYLGWKRLADENGWAFDEALNHRLRGIPRMASLAVILDHNGVSISKPERQELAARKNSYYRELLKTVSHGDLYPGAVPFLEALRRRGAKLGLCSSSRNAWTVLDTLDLARFFDVVITGHDFERPKPDPQIFLLAAERLAVPPGGCIVFEDAFSGVQAALAAGMRCVGVGSPETLTNAAQTVTAYEAIDVDALLGCGQVAAQAP